MHSYEYKKALTNVMQTNKSATEYLHLENTNKETIHYNDQIFVVQRFIIIDDFKDDLGYL